MTAPRTEQQPRAKRAAPSRHFLYLREELRAVIAGLDTMPIHEIRALGALFAQAAQRRDRQHPGRAS